MDLLRDGDFWPHDALTVWEIEVEIIDCRVGERGGMLKQTLVEVIKIDGMELFYWHAGSCLPSDGPQTAYSNGTASFYV